MNWVHLHLALNHIPVLGTLFCGILLATAIIRRSEELKRLALWYLVALTLLAIPIKFTGDFAMDDTRDASWMDTGIAERHEQYADRATTAVFVLGLVAAYGVFKGRKGATAPAWVAPVTLALTLATFALMAQTANLGGQLRHAEIRPTTE